MTVISALAILVLLAAIVPNVMTSQGYWTASNSYPPEGLKKYHIFLDGSFPSSAFRAAKIINENLTACLDFSYSYTDANPKPLVCHSVKESDIPLTNDSIIDAGFFVVSDKLNNSNAEACVRVGYHNMYSCDSGGDSWNLFITNIHYNMNKLIYDDVSAYDDCINYNHLKEGSKEFWDCVKEFS
jgi:hypothetical protein